MTTASSLNVETKCMAKWATTLTTNVVEMIPNTMFDRMEVVTIAGYITDEKMHIARDFLEKTDYT